MTSDKTSKKKAFRASPESTQFIPQEDDDQILYEVEQITAERGNKYRVKWAGVNPETGTPWPQDWVHKRDCTDDLVADWQQKKAQKRFKKRGSSARPSTKSRMSTSASTTRRTRKTSGTGSTPQIQTDEELPTHASTPVNTPSLAKRKRRTDSSDSSSDDEEVKERPESHRSRKKRKHATESPIVIVEIPSHRRELESDEELADVQPVKIGPPRGVKRQGDSGTGKSKLQGKSKKTSSLPLKPSLRVPYNDEAPQRVSQIVPTPKPRPKPRVIFKEAESPHHTPSPIPDVVPGSPPQSTHRDPILSPGALARLELFDRTMMEEPDPPADYTPSSPTSRNWSDVPRNDLDAPSPYPPDHLDDPTSSKSRHESTLSKSVAISGGRPSGESPQESRPNVPSSDSRKPNWNRKNCLTELTKLDLPDIAVMAVSASSTVSPVDELVSTFKQPLPPSRPGNSSHSRLQLHRTPSIIESRSKPGKSNAAEPLPSSIESFNSPQVIPAAPETVGLKGKEKERHKPVGDHTVERDDDGVESEDAEESENIDSELRRRGQELFDEHHRKREANCVGRMPRKQLASKPAKKSVLNYNAKPKKLLPFAACRKTPHSRYKPTSENGGIMFSNRIKFRENSGVEAAGNAALDSAVQKMEAAYVDLSGGTRTQSTTLPETQSPAPIPIDNEALREEEEENTQEAQGIAPMIQDHTSNNPGHAVDGDAMPVSNDPDPVEQQVQSQDAPEQPSTRTEDLQLASVLVQASQGQQQLDDIDIPQGIPHDSQCSVLDTPKRHLGEALSLLNVKSEEIQRLERDLAQEQQNAETARIELAKVAQECEALRSSMTEERSRLQTERTSLEDRRKRWTEDRGVWVEEIERWKRAHGIWEKQRREPSNGLSNPPNHSTSLNGDSMMTPPAEPKETLQDAGTVTSSVEATWASEREMLIKERDELSHKVTELGASVGAMAAAKLSAEKDRDFFREQYAQASSYVGSVREENVELEGRVKIAEGQAKEGVAAIKALFETKVKALQDDVYRWKSLADILQVKDSRTNDDVRKRAAEAAELSAICKEMLRENASLEADLRQLGRAQQRVSVQRNKLQRKVVSLTKQKAGLQMRLSKHSTSQDISHSQVLDQSMSFQNDSENWDPNDIDIMPASQVPPPPLDESSYEDVSWFSCMWREETVLCSRMFDSKEDLVRHISEHVHSVGG